MKAVVYTAPGKVETLDVPEPVTLPDEVKVRVEYCALCATDVHVVMHGLYDLKPPMIVGHEMSGTVVEVGEIAAAKSGLKPGDRVCAIPSPGCGECFHCKKGLPMHCDNAGFEPEKKPMDAMAEYRTYYSNQLIKLPDHVSFEKGALVEPISTASRGIELADMKMGSTVFVSGAGSIGLIMLNLIKFKGGTRITVSEPSPQRREMAKALGAQYVIDPTTQDVYEEAMKITDGHGYDYVFEMSGSKAAAPLCPQLIDKAGTIVYFAVYPMDYELPINLYELYMKEARLQFVFTNPYLFPKSVDLLDVLDMDKLIGPTYSIDDADKAFEEFARAAYPKLLIRCRQD